MGAENPPYADVDESVAWVGDTGLFIACGRQQNNKYTALERFARRHDITFLIPQRVYEELGDAPDRSTPGQTPIDSAIDAGWVTVADEPDYTDSTVSRVMDGVRRYIADSSNRNEDHIEKADAALGAVAANCLLTRDAAFVVVVTTDIDAGEGVVAALEANGFEDRVRFEDGFELIDEIT
ncbi:hypothetical protein [Halopiger goleimassiliensis]|uniref:hypothetical protein n=1 Tax=Halopiger goleimassiliensis TaxID=1293048 RepID=UPI0006778BB6|nr:hypothetical protein [Halopiger goleimassiliensis]